MHAELIFPNPANETETAVPGNAVLEDDQTVVWELHDRDLAEGRREGVLDDLEALRQQGRLVRMSFVPGSPPLAEVESGPRAGLDHTRPVDYEIMGIDREKSTLRLRQVGSGAAEGAAP